MTAEVADVMAEQRIKQRFEALTRDLGRLDLVFRQMQPRDAQACALPPVIKGDEEAAIEVINIAPSHGLGARDLAYDCYADLHIKSGLSQKASRRTVGVLWFAPRDNPAKAVELRDTIDRINTAKADIEAIILNNYKARTERFEALHQQCPGVMTLHLYRQIRYYNTGNVTSIRLTWQRKDSRFNPGKMKLLERIYAEMHNASDSYKVPLKALAANIVEAPSHRLRIRRPVKVQPAANIKFGSTLKTVTASMPIIVIQDDPVIIKMPPSFDSETRRQRRSDYSKPRVLGTFAGDVIEVAPETDRDNSAQR